MFNPYYAQIDIRREEPAINEIESEISRIKMLFAKIAESVVVNSLLKAPKDARKNKTIEEKIRKMIETEERLKSVKGFVELWNKWRTFYYDLPPMAVKNNSQITAIENAIQFSKDNDMNLTILIACVHYAFLKRSVRPAFTSVIAYGEDWYEKFYDKVIADISKTEYIERSLR